MGGKARGRGANKALVWAAPRACRTPGLLGPQMCILILIPIFPCSSRDLMAAPSSSFVRWGVPHFGREIVGDRGLWYNFPFLFLQAWFACRRHRLPP